MYTKSLILLALAGVAVSSDITIGSTKHGVKIFDEHREASPALWRRGDDVTISVNETDVISGIIINDARPDKDGEARIVNGGVGQQTVTVELKSPTILRGFDFHIEVYAVPKTEYVPESDADNSNNTTDSTSTVTTTTESTTKTNEEKVSDVTTAQADISTTVIPSGEKVKVPVIIATEDKEQSRQNREITTAKPESTPTTLEPQVTGESSTPVVGVENVEQEVVAEKSAHGAQISGFRPKFVGAYPSHPIASEPSTETTVKSQHKREVVSKYFAVPEEDEASYVESSEEDDDEEGESFENIVPKILLYTTDKLSTPIQYIL